MSKPALHLSLLLFAALGLTACATTSTNGPVATAPTPLDGWSQRIQVQSDADEIRLASHATGLSGNQARALSDFHVRWMQAEGGMITIAAPRDSGQDAGAYRVSADARSFLVSLGAPTDRVRLVGYDAGGDRQAPVVIGYERYVAVAPTCGDWSTMTATFKNDPHAGFGCAIAANTAAQVANPEDLVRSRDMAPADPNRRATVLDKYRKGQITGSARDPQGTGTISQAIQ